MAARDPVLRPLSPPQQWIYACLKSFEKMLALHETYPHAMASEAPRLLEHHPTERFQRTKDLSPADYRTLEPTRHDVFDHIERFHNPARRHSTLGYLSPTHFKKQAHVA